MNLLKETLTKIKDMGKTTKDILWCGSENFGWFTWEDFSSLANVEYDGGYGAAEVAQDLKVVGNDFWLERHEYDGSEWWEFKEIPKKPEEFRKPVALTIGQAQKLDIAVSCGWEDLEEINGKGSPNAYK